VHQIGVLPILTYAEEHNELLSDPVSLNHVIESIHPLIGDKLLRSGSSRKCWSSCRANIRTFLANPQPVDYIDLVQIATVFCLKQGDSALLNLELSTLPAFRKAGP
jgi:HD-like signal output (HDOD) protein